MSKRRGRHGGPGSVRHFDSSGHRTGYSRPNIKGGFTDYDKRGRTIGYSRPNSDGGYDHYNNRGEKISSSGRGDYTNGTSRVTHSSSDYRYNSSSSSSGSSGSYSSSSSSGSSTPSSSGGCYVATCVYGSYDCPPVWTLRRFRDHSLAKTAAGRTFIRTYYAVSPTIVKWFGNTAWFRAIFRKVLDRMVTRLNAQGVDDTPYRDRSW